jgi:hypothetical protein
MVEKIKKVKVKKPKTKAVKKAKVIKTSKISQKQNVNVKININNEKKPRRKTVIKGTTSPIIGIPTKTRIASFPIIEELPLQLPFYTPDKVPISIVAPIEPVKPVAIPVKKSITVSKKANSQDTDISSDSLNPKHFFKKDRYPSDFIPSKSSPEQTLKERYFNKKKEQNELVSDNESIIPTRIRQVRKLPKLRLSKEPKEDYVINPKTNRYVKVGTNTYKSLLNDGLISNNSVGDINT